MVRSTAISNLDISLRLAAEELEVLFCHGYSPSIGRTRNRLTIRAMADVNLIGINGSLIGNKATVASTVYFHATAPATRVPMTENCATSPEDSMLTMGQLSSRLSHAVLDGSDVPLVPQTHIRLLNPRLERVSRPPTTQRKSSLPKPPGHFLSCLLES